ncbi:MAG: family 20 glycosylhydrolase, partial [Clostridiales bacterium]|nr:family 20 glycosylhydrolase [Clostridiales bacterium]
MKKRLLAILLSLVLMLSLLPASALAAGDSADTTMRVFHLDCGRKYFTEQQIKNLIDQMAEDGYNYLELAVGNDGLRFLLDDMSLSYSVDGTERSFTSD